MSGDLKHSLIESTIFRILSDMKHSPERAVRNLIDFGIDTHLLSVSENPEKVIQMIQEQPDCAFILFLQESEIMDDFIEKVKSKKNVMVIQRKAALMSDIDDTVYRAKK